MNINISKKQIIIILVIIAILVLPVISIKSCVSNKSDGSIEGNYVYVGNVVIGNGVLGNPMRTAGMCTPTVFVSILKIIIG